MRRIVIWFASTLTVVVLLFGYHTSTNSPGTPAAASAPAATAPTSGSSSAAPSSSPTPSASSIGSTSDATRTTTGPVVQTRWGPVQVELTTQGRKLTDVQVVQYPNGNSKDAEINDYALPVLVKDTLAAQSANIDMVSGATVTSTGYLQSLQAALDDAGL